MSHFEKCCASMINQADMLIERIKNQKLNVGAFEGLMSSFLDRPAYYPEWRDPLLTMALERLDRRGGK